HLQRFDAGRLGISSLQAGDDLTAAVAQAPVLIEIEIGAVLDEAAVSRVDGKGLGERRRKRLLDPGGCGFEPSPDAGKLLRQPEGARAMRQAYAKAMRCADCRPAVAEVARTPATQRQTRQRAGKVGSLVQFLAQVLPQPRLVGEK